MSRCAIYARFSSDRQSQTSADDQVADCRARAEREGWEVVQVYADLAISGANNRRPGMTAMLADAAAGSFDIVLAEALDRIARNQADIATIYQRLVFADVRIETLSEGHVNELHIGLKGTMGALFLKDLGEKIRRGQRGSVSRGRIPGGLCYGYDVVRELNDKGELEAGRRRINPDQAEVVVRILAEYVAGRSPKLIAHGLNLDGIVAARGGEWRANAIVGNKARMIGILHNPIYVGRFAYNRVRMLTDPESRNRVSRPNAASDLQFAELPELRIVTDELWEAAQEAREQRGNGKLVHRRRPKHLLSGLVRCGLCDGSYTVISDNRMGCARHREAGTCSNARRIERTELQRRVISGLEDQLLSPEAVSLLVREYHVAREKQVREGAKTRLALERRLRTAEAAIARLVAAIADGAADFSDIKAALAEKTAERDAARAGLGEEDAVPVIALHPRIAEAYRARIRGLSESIGRGEAAGDPVVAQIRELIQVVYVKPLDDGNEVEVIPSLQSAVAFATGSKSNTTRRRFPVADMMVAKEGLEPPTPGL
ncbi:recombinase family protein [Sphingomonas sp. PP-CE-1G-424]|uniref:recombinase family protein n=1 Tax=Sphingomonas sp. PP-CE-1G-424 TaxID=2135658 RepID=UPI0010554A67|nr:recombinase family protein [Sphingomonas sp. PP-CE-1G-424]